MQAREQLKEAEEAERQAFAAAVAEWRRGTGPAAGCKRSSDAVLDVLC